MTERIWLSNRAKGQPMWPSIFCLSVGLPKATEKFTVEQLEDMGLVGVYRDADDPAANAR